MADGGISADGRAPGNALATVAKPADGSRVTASGRPTHIPLALLLIFAAALLLVGASKNVHFAPDLAAYRCYGLAFWGSGRAAAAASLPFCRAYLGGIPAHPVAILPREYGPLALLVFAPPALAPAILYPWLFAAEMLLVVCGITALLRRTGVPGAAHAWLFYVLLGSMATALSRFDLVPAACVVLALLILRRGRHTWAYAALAVGVLLKFYPLILLPLFLVETWRSCHALMLWRRPMWRGPAVFVGMVATVEGAGALVAPAHMLEPLRFLGERCVQVESLPATLSSLWSQLSGARVTLMYSTASNAMCQQSPGLGALVPACAMLAALGALAVLALRWRGRLSLVDAAVLLLCLSMLGSKVFSPQYLLWVTPLVAWEHGLRLRPFLVWATLCLATTLCFPLSYGSVLLPALHLTSQQMVPVTAGLRNLLLVALVLGALIRTAVAHRSLPAPLAMAP